MARTKTTNGTNDYNDAVTLSLKQAAEYTGKTKQALAKAIAAPSNAAIFDGNVTTRIVHPDFPPLTEINKSALDAWLSAMNTAKSLKVGARRARNADGRRYVIRVPDTAIDAVKALLAEQPVTWVAENTKRKPKAEPTTDQSTADMFTAELVEA